MKKNSINLTRKTLQHSGMVIVILIMTVIFFLPFIQGHRSFIWDTREFGYPYLAYITQSIHQGTSVFWDLKNFSGYPFVGNIESSMFYPVIWLFAIIFGKVQFSQLVYYILFHFLLGGIGAYFLNYKLTKNSTAALIGATVFEFSGYAIGHLSHLGQDISYMWIPFIFLAFIAALERKTIVSVLGAGLVLGCAVLIGHPNTILYIFYSLGACLLFMCLINKQDWKKTSLSGIGAIIMSLLIAAIMILPVFQLTLQSDRTTLTYQQQSLGFSLNPENLLGMLNANHNGILSEQPLQTFHGSVDITQNYLYIGILPLLLIVGSLFAKDRKRWIFWILAIISLFAAFGTYTPVNWLLFNYMPGFNKVRMAVQIMAIFFFSLSVLTAYGTARIFEFLPKKTPATIVLGLGLILYLFTAADIFTKAFNQNFYSEPISPSQIYDSQNDKNFMAEFQNSKIKNDQSSSPLFRIDDEIGTFIQNKWAYYGFDNAWGNSGIHIKKYDNLFDRKTRGTWQLINDNLFDLLNIQYVITERDLDNEQFTKIGNNIYQNNNVLPRAYFVTDFQVETDETKQLALLKNGQINFHDKVLLKAPPAYQGEPNDTAKNISIQWLKNENQNITLRVSEPTNAILFISEIDYPGWTLTVDGKPAQYQNADYVFRAVPLTKGEHTLEFKYKNTFFVAGEYISFGALLLFIGSFGYFALLKPKLSGK